jgi:nitroimidazol reductase NimA-like FMN-containing flavoprotein (pyridoxamine 5'-phosphate oxidase superfamily)
MELVERAIEVLKASKYINVATITPEGLPWNTPLYARYDANLHFYWSSWIGAQHSENIRNNPNVFITLYDTNRRRFDNNRRCAYFAGRAVELSESEEIEEPLLLLYGDDWTNPRTPDYVGESIRRIYRATVDRCWLNDRSDKEVTKETQKMRVDVPLELLRKMVFETTL